MSRAVLAGSGMVVTFVVIAHNEADHIADCLSAIEDQDTELLFDVVLVDDGSEDETAAVARSLVMSHPLIVVNVVPNRGRGAARAIGVESTSAALVAFVDADITIPRDWLKRCLASLPGHAAVGGIAVPDGHTAVLARITRARPRQAPGSLPITGANVLFDAKTLKAFPFDPTDRIGEDFRQASRMLKSGAVLQRVPGLVVVHNESKSYGEELRWRFDNGRDAVAHVRDFGPRFPDLVWLGWMLAWSIGILGSIVWSPLWILVGILASTAIGFIHAITRFHLTPVRPFLAACLADVPLMNANMVGRTVFINRLLGIGA